MSHDQYDDDDYQDGGYPNPEQAYDEPNGFDDGYDDRNPHDADEYDQNTYSNRDYDDPPQDGYPDESPVDDIDNPDLDADLSGDPRHVSQVYQDEAGDIMDHDPITEYLKSKDPDWDQQPPETKNLLDLPEDILRLIVKEASHALDPLITHTNDLTSLALTNSTLYKLAIPHIYSRFDIVWPDAHTTTTEAKSVDALTYGLSTLCLGSSFARTTTRFRNYGDQTPAPIKFGDNNYAQHTRKFSLGNGPNDWVAEYMINKESGKMLGTLVALAVSKMKSLETFIWDMPTGVLSDIFIALGSLPDEETRECMLERVWIRWHDNNDTGASPSSSSSPAPAAPQAAVVPAGSTLTPIGIALPSTASHPAPSAPFTYSENQVEYPTFSVLPPLKSLTVLDVDELAYLDEMAVLVERSKDVLQELRLGVSSKAVHKDFVQTWDSPELQQVDHNARWPGESSIGERRLGGILGVLVGRVYDIRRKIPKTKPAPPLPVPESSPGQHTPLTGESGAPPLSGDAPPPPFSGEPSPAAGTPSLDTEMGSRRSSTMRTPGASGPGTPARKRLDGKLKLTTLELERVPLSMQVCSKAFDWTVLTSLTILDCAQHENLWKLLKKQFEPKPQESGYGISPTSSKPVPNGPMEYQLGLKTIHTDQTSQSLIAFIKETLAPNSLECLFLQDRRRGTAASAPPQVTIDSIFKGAIKRHRNSLKKLLLDSSNKTTSSGANSAETMRWRSWCLTSDLLQYITSGRMKKLKELSVSIDYKDWHTFLQRLPHMSQLRSLHIPYMADHVISNFEPKELVMQVADIITLCPDIQLCYVGISTKCFEIMEQRATDNAGAGLLNGNGGAANGVNGHGSDQPAAEVDEATDEDENDTEDNSDDPDDSDDEGTPTSPTDPDETQSEEHHSDEDSDDDDSFVEPAAKTRLRLREILFYDDKVAIFKARHGRL
ncbi:f-box domain-containing protein [Diaporthe amygdali]|uniref:f-box domain-containing protein n=1 Tax=Phomopsis amygdali TaxID=1214568 RepID=UPI0022FE4DE2|nr:f-box domain-containing protein [Diaporthe amygdali]KAJ0114350.1 f-box domain-containing protein [Diaporthe amygdali]